MKNPINIFDENVTYEAVDDRSTLDLIDTIRKGLGFKSFTKLVKVSPFSANEWAEYLHISERTMQRYKKEKKAFDSVQSERILQILLLNKLGNEVFGSQERYNRWLETENLALGKVKPKQFLDSSFGIDLMKDELRRIEYGVLA